MSKMVAVGKIGLGSARIVSGLATAFGKGLLGAYLQNHHLTRVAAMVAKSSLEGGGKMVENGWRELNE
jgi:hypothetical protein